MRNAYGATCVQVEGFQIQRESSAIHAALRTADFHCVWLPEQSARCKRQRICATVAFPLSFDRRGNWMGDVSVLTLKNAIFADELTLVSRGCHCELLKTIFPLWNTG